MDSESKTKRQLERDVAELQADHVLDPTELVDSLNAFDQTVDLLGPTRRADAMMTFDETGRLTRPTEPGPHLEPGALINGSYRVEQYLGAGGMGVVYLATDPLNDDRQVALKTIGGASISQALVGLFRVEFRTLTKLRHPNVVGAFDFEALQGSDDHFFTMEFVEGRDILHATEGADWKSVVALLVQVCRALSYVHSRQLIHYDLKPANVLVETEGQAKVLDFGLAGGRPTAVREQISGTPPYMAPELTEPEASVDHRVDLYSLGIMAYQLLSRRLPFVAPSFPELMYMHRFNPIQFDDRTQAVVPSWLRSVIERLCAKRPADRYPSANAAIEDINRRGGLSYELQTHETRESYILSSSFVGRSVEYDRLKNFVAKRTQGLDHTPITLLVGGQSGTGKSRLLREVRYQTQLSRIPFCQGRCFEGTRSEFDPLVPVLEYLARLAEALGGADLVQKYGPELVEVSPGLAKQRNIEPSAPLPEVVEEKARLRENVIEFLVQVAGIAPYVVYIDDLQWAHSGLAELLTQLARRVAIQEGIGERVKIAMLGAYRDDEVEGRPLKALLDTLEAEQAHEQLNLAPLDAPKVGEVLQSMLGVEELPDAFVERVANETAGNPFFVEEVMRSLVEQGVVYIDAGAWAAREDVGHIEIPSTVADVFRRRAEMLDESQQALLDLLAVSGRPVALEILSHASGMGPEPVAEALSVLSQRRIAIASPGQELSYHLSHDRMRETVYHDLEPVARSGLHLQIARSMEEIYQHDLEEHLFDITDHYNSGSDLVFEADERARIAEINRRAGEKATAAAAFDAAQNYGHAALNLLPDNAWNDDYERVAGLTKNLMEVEYFGDNLERAEEHFDLFVSNARTDLEKVDAHILKANAYSNNLRLYEAIEASYDALRVLGHNYIEKPGMTDVMTEFEETKLAFEGRSPNALSESDQISDPSDQALSILLENALTPAFLTYQQELFAYLDLKGVQLIARSGLTRSAPSLVAGYAFLLANGFGEWKTALEYTAAAVQVGRKFGEPRALGRVLFWAGAFLFPWKHHLSENVDLLLEGYEHCLSAGDLLFAGFCLNLAITHEVNYGESVDTTLAFLREHHTFIMRLNNPHTVTEVTAVRQLVKLLAGRTKSRSSFDDEEFDEARFLEYLLEIADPIPIGYYYALKLKALYIMGLDDEGLELVPEADKRSVAAKGHFMFTEQLFYSYMTVARGYEGASASKRQEYLHGMKEKLDTMKGWATVCSANFRHKLALMEAEMARIERDHERAASLYEEATSSAHDDGWPLIEALAHEVAGRFHLSEGHEGVGRQHLSRAREGYQRYGAEAKVSSMDEAFRSC